MVLSGILGRSNLAGLSATVSAPEEVYDGTETLLTLRIARGRRLFPSFLLQAEIGEGEALFTIIGRKEEASARIPMTFRGRGSQRLPPVRVRSIFPVNFFIRARTWDLQREVIVFPALRPCRPDVEGEKGSEKGEMESRGRGEEGDIRRIGEYRGGEPLRTIHWKLSARHDELKVVERSGTAREPLIIEPSGLPGQGLEERLRCAAYLITRALKEDLAVGLRLGSRLLPPGTGRAHKLLLLKELAFYDPGQNPS